MLRIYSYVSLVLRFSNSGTVGISVKGDRPRETNNLPAKDNHAPLPNDPRIPLGNDIRKIKIQSIERRIGYASPFQSDFYRSYGMEHVIMEKENGRDANGSKARPSR